MTEPAIDKTGRVPASRRYLVESAVAAAVGLLLAVFFTWPAMAHPASTIPGDLGDPLYQAWQLAWGGHALLTAPLSVFDANILYPLENTLAFSDSLLGYAPLGFVGSGVEAALVRYNVAYVIAYALAFLGAYVLARQVGCGRWGALVAGVAFAYAPWRYAHNGHLNILSSGGIPLALACLARGHGLWGRAPQPRWALAGWLVAAWQLTIGFGLGLQFAYLMGALTLLTGVSWLVRGRQPVPRRLLAADAGGLAVFLLVGALLAGPYLSAVEDHPQARRSVGDVELFSPPLKGYLVAPAESRVWGQRTEAQRKELLSPPEQARFPGATLLVLAGLGLLAGGWPLRRRLALAGAALVVLLLSLGTTLGGGRFSYLLLFEHAPGWQGVRTPGRLVTLVTLALCLLAATGVDRLQRWLKTPGAGGLAGAALVGLVLVEGLNVVGNPSPGRAPEGWQGVRGPVMALPSDYFSDYAAMLWSTQGLPEIVNGTAGFTPKELDAIRQQTAGFPDAASIAALQAIGVRTVLLDTTRTAGTPWEQAATKPVDGLGITARPQGTTTVYEIPPAG